MAESSSCEVAVLDFGDEPGSERLPFADMAAKLRSGLAWQPAGEAGRLNQAADHCGEFLALGRIQRRGTDEVQEAIFV